MYDYTFTQRFGSMELRSLHTWFFSTGPVMLKHFQKGKRLFMSVKIEFETITTVLISCGHLFLQQRQRLDLAWDG